jgi:membrane protease YdiL (CAAX protease family)
LAEDLAAEASSAEPDKLRGYKTVCAKLGIVMGVYFALQLLTRPVAEFFIELSGTVGPTAANALYTVAVVILAYVLPIMAAAFLFKGSSRPKLGALYKRPKRLARALGSFPAMYGMGYGTASLTMLATYALARFTSISPEVEELFRPVAIEPSRDLAGVVIMVLLMVVAAPIFEEFLVRGIFYGALAPYGCGIAIIISSLLFGLIHGSLYMLFYTTVLGLALGYIRYATNSLFVCTILHAIINSVSAGLLFVSSLRVITEGASKLVNTLYSVYITAVLVLVCIGIYAFVAKIPAIKKYKIENPWPALSGGKKAALFFASPCVVVMLALAINEHAGNPLLNLFDL